MKNKPLLAVRAKQITKRKITSGHAPVYTNTGLKRIIDDPVYIGQKRVNYAKSTGDGKHWTPKPESEWVYHDVPPIIEQEQWDALASSPGGPVKSWLSG